MKYVVIYLMYLCSIIDIIVKLPFYDPWQGSQEANRTLTQVLNDQMMMPIHYQNSNPTQTTVTFSVPPATVTLVAVELEPVSDKFSFTESNMVDAC